MTRGRPGSLQSGLILTVAVVEVLRPPHHGVGLPVPDAGHHLLLEAVHPGQLVVGTVEDDLVPQLPLLKRPVDVHPLPGGGAVQATPPLCQPQDRKYFPGKILNWFPLISSTYFYTPGEFCDSTSC